METKGERRRQWEDLGDGTDTHTLLITIDTVYKRDNEWAPTLEPRELYSVLHGDLNGKEIQNRADICICMADSFCCTAETNTTLQSNYTPVKINFKKYMCTSKSGGWETGPHWESKFGSHPYEMTWNPSMRPKQVIKGVSISWKGREGASMSLVLDQNIVQLLASYQHSCTTPAQQPWVLRTFLK